MVSKSNTYIERIFTKADIKFVKSLGERSFRYANKLFVAEGNKSVMDILSSGLRPHHLFCLQGWNGLSHTQLLNGASLSFVKEKEIEQLSSLKSTREVVGIFQMPAPRFNPKNLKGLTLALDTLQDPGNLGTLIRLADWYGIETILCSQASVDCYNPKTVQATMGSLGRVEVVYGNLSQWFETLDMPVLAAEMNGTPSREVLFPKDCILLIGNEGQGVSENLKPFIQQSITIERRGKAESLNAAMATTILVDRYFGQVF